MAESTRLKLFQKLIQAYIEGKWFEKRSLIHAKIEIAPSFFETPTRKVLIFSKFSKLEVLYNEVKILILSDGIFTF